MSQENVTRARAICAPWEHGDYRFAEWAHEHRPQTTLMPASIAAPTAPVSRDNPGAPTSSSPGSGGLFK
jgi:hypothetical protein